jgi:hypothetical protein
LYDGFSHNLYLGGGATRIQYSYIHDSTNGQNVKSRGHYTELFYNLIAYSQDGEIGLVDDPSETGLPDSNAVLIGNVVVSKPRMSGYNCCRFVWFGQDSGGPHTGTLYAFNNTFVAAETRINFLDANTTGSAIVASNNIFFGSQSLRASSFSLSGGNNWASSGTASPAGLSGTVLGADPLFVVPGSRDYRLQASSPCIDKGTSALTYLDGSGNPQPGAPLDEYVLDLQGMTRPSDAHLDIGAFEYGTGSPDAGNPSQAGLPPDGGTTPLPDGGSGLPLVVSSGCGCQSEGSLLPIHGLVLAWLIAMRWQRRWGAQAQCAAQLPPVPLSAVPRHEATIDAGELLSEVPERSAGNGD